MIKIIFALFLLNLKLIWRNCHDWLHPLIFFASILVLCPLAFALDATSIRLLAPGSIWIAAFFASLFSIQHFFVGDLQDGFLQEMLLAEIPLTLLIFVKWFTHWLMSIIPLIIVVVIFSQLYHLNFSSTLVCLTTLILGTPILTLIETFCAALTLSLRQPGVILGILIFPLILPVILFGININLQYMSNLSILAPLSFLAGLSILTITILPPLISASLRLSQSR